MLYLSTDSPSPSFKSSISRSFLCFMGLGGYRLWKAHRRVKYSNKVEEVPYIQARINIFLGYSKQALPQQGNIAQCASLGCCRLPVFFHPESPESQTKCSYENLSLGLDKLSPIHSSGLLLLPSLSGDSAISGTSGEAELIEMLSYPLHCVSSSLETSWGNKVPPFPPSMLLLENILQVT